MDSLSAFSLCFFTESHRILNSFSVYSFHDHGNSSVSDSAVRVRRAAGQRGHSGAAAVHVLSDAVRVHQSGVRAPDAAAHAQLAAALQVLPLVAVLHRRLALRRRHVHVQLVLRPHRHRPSQHHLQIH